MPKRKRNRGHRKGATVEVALFRTLTVTLLFTWFSNAAVIEEHVVELDEHLDGELRAECAMGDHLVDRLGEAHSDGGPHVQLEGSRHRPSCLISSYSLLHTTRPFPLAAAPQDSNGFSDWSRHHSPWCPRAVPCFSHVWHGAAEDEDGHNGDEGGGRASPIY